MFRWGHTAGLDGQEEGGDCSPELDINRESTPLLVALIAVASQPNFAVRTSYNMYRTSQDKVIPHLPSLSGPLTRPHLL
jgi:hypothetical protein